MDKATPTPASVDERDIVVRLRDTPNWMYESYGSWKDSVCKYSRAPFEAADEIERLRAEVERLAAQSAPTYSGWVWKHIKSGGEYELLGNAKVQCDEPLTDMAEVYVYQGEDGRMWARPVAEFNARFKRSRPHGRPIAAQPSQAPVVQAVDASAPAVRMLTEDEAEGVWGRTGLNRVHYAADVIREFCAVNAGRAIPADGKIGGV